MKALEGKYPHLFWTSCAAHCLVLIFKGNFKLKNMKTTFERVVKLNSYIYTRRTMVNMLRQFTKYREIIRPSKTRFAMTFLTLDIIHNQRANLRNMVSSKEYLESKYSKERSSKDYFHAAILE